MSDHSEAYRFSRVQTTDASIREYSELLSLVFPQTAKFTESFLRWQYQENPDGEAVGFDAYFQEQLAGHYVTIPVKYQIGAQLYKGLLSLNTATHPEHRGKGLFTKLANMTYELAKEERYDFVIGVANQNSTHGFLKKLGFQLVAPLEVKIGLGSYSYDRDDYKMRSVRDEEALRWRLKNPESEYYYHGDQVRSKTHKSFLDAIMHISDEDLGDLEPRRSFLTMWIGLAKHRKRGSLLFTLPKKLRPAPLNLILKDLAGNMPQIDKEDILFELIDFDGY